MLLVTWGLVMTLDVLATLFVPCELLGALLGGVCSGVLLLLLPPPPRALEAANPDEVRMGVVDPESPEDEALRPTEVSAVVYRTNRNPDTVS